MQLSSRQKKLDLTTPKVMGVLNLTPDSFSDGGRYLQLDAALYQAEAMILAGASIIDIGGESTRPSAIPVELDEELMRVIPVVERLSQEFDVFLSIDTYKPQVMVEASYAGIDMINDIWALQQPNALAVAHRLDLPVCLMHMQGTPQTMQVKPNYQDDPCRVISDFFAKRVNICLANGISRNNLILDPGFGFGKTVEHNYQILSNIQLLRDFNLPLLIGLSRKSMLSGLCQLGNVKQQKLVASVTGAAIAALQGANIVRVHDVLETVTALKVVEMVLNFRS